MVLNGKVERGIIKCQAKVGTKGLHISTLSSNSFCFLAGHSLCLLCVELFCISSDANGKCCCLISLLSTESKGSLSLSQWSAIEYYF